MKTFTPFTLLLTLALTVSAAPLLEQTPVWTSGQDGYHTYRIPSLLVTPKQTVLAFCEGRKTGGGDHGDLDLMMKRSTDGGRTWSAQQVVHEEGGDAKITIGNPCPVVDEKTGTIWLPFTRDNKGVFVTSSKDEGKTWSTPLNLSDKLMKPDWTWIATGPGVGIQLKRGPYKGRLVIPSDHRRKLPDGTQEHNSHMIYSDDGGGTWKNGDPIQVGGNECQVIERTDGSLMVNARMQGDFKGMRGVAVSGDGGVTWITIKHDPQLPCPKCQGSISRYSEGDAHSKGQLLFSNPRPRDGADTKAKSARTQLTIRMSTDDGETWPISKELNAGPSAYSNLGRLADGTILCLYEGGEKRGSEFIRLARFNLEWLKDGKTK